MADISVPLTELFAGLVQGSLETRAKVQQVKKLKKVVTRDEDGEPVLSFTDEAGFPVEGEMEEIAKAASLPRAAAPVWLTSDLDWSEAVMRAEAARPRAAGINVSPVQAPAPLPREEWERKAKVIDIETAEIKRQLAEKK